MFKLPLIICYIAFLFATFGVYFSIVFHGLRNHPKAIYKIVSQEIGKWELYQNNGRIIQASLCGDSLITSCLCILHFKSDHRLSRYPVLILYDMLDKDSFRSCRQYICYTYSKKCH